MKYLYFSFPFLFLFLCLNSFAQQPVYFTSHPGLSPDGKTVVFSYSGDIWKASTDNGQATRLTGMQGMAINPRISPDGKWLAFSADQYGNMDVYVMPLAGGDIKRITHHSAGDEVDGWSWDSKTIYFTSGRYNRYSAYKVGVEGGTADRLFGHYFNTIHNVVESPDGQLYFSDTWESKDQAQRKGYKGAFNPEIQSYNPKTKTYKKYTDYIGKDFWTSVDKKGNVYFVSDEANGEYNLYTFLNGKKTQLTNFDTSIKRPFVSADGSKVVFEKDYQLYEYDVAAKKSELLRLVTNRSNTLQMETEFAVDGKISSFDVSPDGKKFAFISRGELFVSDVAGKFIQKIDRPTVERAMEVKWLADNKTLLFNQTYNGYQNWFTIQADNSGELKQFTFDERNNRAITFNSKREKGVYLSGRDEVRVLNLKSGKSEVLVKDEIWALQNASPSFSPNDEYVVFTAYRNFEQDIFVHHLKNGQTINITNTGVTETNPAWSPDGKYIYFTSSLTKPAYPFGLQNPGVYRVALDHYDEPYRADKFDELFEKKKKRDTVEVKLPKTIVINTNRIMDRLERISPSFGAQYGPDILQRGGKTYVFYSSNQGEGKPAIYRTVIEPFEQRKTEKVMDGGSFSPVEVDGKYFTLIAGSINSFNIDANKAAKIAMNYKFSRNLADEFTQMYYETWAGMDENFYDENFHGKDWKKVKDQYEKYLPFLNNRSDLRVVLNDMLGELNASHTGFSTGGPDEGGAGRMVTNETGILFNAYMPYKVESIVTNSTISRNEDQVVAGDILTHVDGKKVDVTIDRDAYFTGPTLQSEMTLQFDRKGKSVTVRVHPQSNGALKSNLYDEWIQLNRDRTDEWGNNRIAYSHMKDMGGEQLESFLKDMVSQEDKDGIILDLRYNTGGNVHDEVLKFLSQRPYLNWQYRGGKLSPQSNFAPAAKPIVLLINEQSLSDAEMTAAGFKALGLGTIIGNETYRWIIFTSGKSLVDGSMYRIPAWGTYTLEGENIEQNGVKPDVLIKNTFVDRIENNDPQLKKATEFILQKLN